jgi:hypothetical protein
MLGVKQGGDHIPTLLLKLMRRRPADARGRACN